MPTTVSSAGPAQQPAPAARAHRWRTPHFANLALPAKAEEAATIRHWSAHTLSRWGVNGAELDDALLVIGEFAANAVEHGGEDMSVALTMSGSLLTVAVSDNGTTGPEEISRDTTVNDTDVEDVHGRGLVLVAALALAWGATALLGGGVILSAELPVHL
jgi:anti-sigma regulatory factor (Ser/Thr protein kinase)